LKSGNWRNLRGFRLVSRGFLIGSGLPHTLKGKTGRFLHGFGGGRAVHSAAGAIPEKAISYQQLSISAS
jgi:hypothetical protein